MKDFLYDHVIKTPNRDFILHKKKIITYSEFNTYCENILNYLQVKISSKDDYVGLLLKNKIYLLASIIAVNRLGKIPVIFPDKKVIKNTELYATTSKSKALIADDNICSIQLNKSVKLKKYNFSKNNIQCVLFTSGTVSGPKAVQLTAGNMYASANAWDAVMKFKKDDIYLNILPIFHISGLSIFFRSLFIGFKMVLGDYNSSSIHKYISDYRCTHISMVPKMIYDLRDFKLNTLKNLKALIVGGDILNETLYSYIYNNKIPVYCSYGLTETSSGISGYWIKSNKIFSNYIGNPHKNVEISVKDKRIQIKSDVVMHSYFKGSMCNGKFLTDDQAVNEEGRIFFIKRLNNIAVSGGENINLDYVKKIIKNINIVNECYLTKNNDKAWGEILVLFVEFFNKEANINQLKEYCKCALPDYMVPKKIIPINKIPKLDNGQIDRNLINFYLIKAMQ